MRPAKYFKLSLCGGLAVLLALASSPEARANVYASNIKLNGALSSVTNAPGNPVTISYILNEAATLGTTINILSGTNVVDTISIASGGAGARRGSNSIVWGGTNSGGGNVPGGTYSVSITAAASGFTNWTQTSVDTNQGNTAYYPWGIDVDKNTNSLFYGRVVMGCAISGASTNPAAKDGLYKMNADGSMADEGWYGNANYLSDDAGDSPTTGQMPNSFGYNPLIIRIGADDRIYWDDNTAVGAINSCDMQATNYELVINSGTYVGYYGQESVVGGPHNYQNTLNVSYIAGANGYGIQQFDVAGSGTNMALYLCDTGDTPSWGIWMFHLTNGASDTNDTEGTQAVATDGDLTVTGAGLSVDNKLDIFVGQSLSTGSDPTNRAYLYTNWNSGILPPEKGGTNYAEATGTPPPAWKVGSADPYMTAIFDTVINSRVNPTMVAVCMAQGASVSGGYEGDNGGIRVLNATNGATIVTNLDIANWYNAAAFDNVGNVYGASRSINVWRVWSPPGTNQATTVAVEMIQVSAPASPLVITSIHVSGGTVTINFTGAASDTPSNLFVLSSTKAVPASGYAIAGGASVSQVSSGVFQATVPVSGLVEFYRIER